MAKEYQKGVSVRYDGTNQKAIEELIGCETVENVFSEKNNVKMLTVKIDDDKEIEIIEEDVVVKLQPDDRCEVIWGANHYRLLHGKRQEANRKILEKLAILVEKYPQQRFGQLITNYLFPDYRSHDIFFDESAETLETLNNTILSLKHG